jgi:hypothetical protein
MIQGATELTALFRWTDPSRVATLQSDLKLFGAINL